MRFTIESFKTSLYRPAEWMVNNESIIHLISDLNKQFCCVSFAYECSEDGYVFRVIVDNDTTGNACLTVKFLSDYKVEVVENIDNIIVDSASKEKRVPYWTAVAIQRKIVSTVFKVLSQMQVYDDISVVKTI